MMTQRLILLCWIVFITYWIINAWTNKKTVERSGLKAFIIYRIPLILGALLLVLPHAPPPLNTPVIPHLLLLNAISVGLCVLGLCVAIWARRTLAANWSSEVVFKERHELIERGPYGFVRHPIYTGMLLMLLGTALAMGRLASLLGFLLMAVSFLLKLRQEETLMLRHFPTEYAAYRSRTKTLIPFLW
jgi:protein-S-isoprenylcysteine O-methyltransferase Ste14